MIKKYSKVILFLMFIMLFPNMVQAIDNSGCPAGTFRISKTSGATIGVNGGNYTLDRYVVDSGGSAYCLSPGMKAPTSGGVEFVCSSLLDITGAGGTVNSQKLAVSMQKIHEIKGNASAEALEIAYRWLAQDFPTSDIKYTNNSTSQHYSSVNNTYWNTNDPTVVEAKRLYYAAKSAADKVNGAEDYNNLVQSGEISAPSYSVEVVESKVEGSSQLVTYHATINNVNDSYWNQMQIQCSGCSLVSQSPSGNSNTFTVRYNGSTSSAFAIVGVNSSNLSNMLIATNPANMQTMLIDFNGNGGGNPDGNPPTIRIPLEPTGKCISRGGSEYDYCDFVDGVETNCRPITDPQEQIALGCPVGVCRQENGIYYGPSGTPVTPDEFYNECCDLLDPSSPEYMEYCGCGEPDINYIGACSEFNAGQSPVVNHVSDTKEDADLQVCLFRPGSKDMAQNSFKMTDQPDVATNRYCKVSCIERYDFELPSAKYTTSGGYFTLSSRIAGERSCYINASRPNVYTGIDLELLVDDLTAASEKLANAQAAYNKAKLGMEHIASKTEGCQDTTIYYNTSYTYTAYKVSRVGRGSTGIILTPVPTNVGESTWTDGTASSSHSAAGPIDPSTGAATSVEVCDDNGTNGSEEGLKEKIGNLEALKTAIDKAKSEIVKIQEEYKKCFNWENNFEFNPEIHFTYDEPYQNMGGFNDQFVQSDRSDGGERGECIATTSNYECSGNGVLYEQQYVDCNGDTCEIKTYANSSTRFIKDVKQAEATYRPKNDFSVYTPMGTITLNQSGDLYTLLCKEGNCLPVSLNSPTGVFNYNFVFSNIGQYNDSNANGRLMGGSPNVFDAVGIDASYVCNYINNCPDCDFVCVGDGCEIIGDKEPDCPDCPFVCQNCIFDGNANTFMYRTVSLTNVTPNQRTYGPNWTNEKGEYTKKVIEDSGEEVYSKPDYAYKLTANQMGEIRRFNSNVNGYLNTRMPDGSNALSCNSYGSSYDNLVCISSFLDTPGSKYFTEIARNDTWTLWENSGYFNSSTRYSVIDGMGPAWK